MQHGSGPSRSSRRRTNVLAGLTLAATIAVTGCSGTTPTAGGPNGTTGGTGGTATGGTATGAVLVEAHPNLQLASAIQPFTACDDLLGYVKKAALDRVGPYGLPGNNPYPEDVILEEGDASGPPRTPTMPAPPTTAAPATTTPASGAPVPAPPSNNRASDGATTSTGESETTTTAGSSASGDTPAFSETNVQEKGVDEPDTIKTDGKRILTVTGNRLYNVDVSAAAPATAGSIALPGNGGTQLLVSGNHLLAIAPDTSYADSRSSSESYRAPTSSTLLSIIDVADAKNMKVLNSVRVDGTFVSARMVDGQARVVTSSTPAQLPFVYPSSSTANAENAAEAANKRIIEDSKIEDWLPSVRIGETVTPTVKPLLDCAKVSHPKTFSGFGTVAVISVDVSSNEVDPADAVGIMADGQTVYASKESLYVATPSYVEPTLTDRNGQRRQPPVPAQPFKNTTSIHKFSIAAKGPATYRASGDVEGSLLSEYSLSDEGGTLRVATTASRSGCPACGGGSETFVRVLQELEGELRQVGSIGNMGHGEQVKAVRFVGNQGYVVTFRQTDPLYTIDLTQPTDPKVVGELKMLGYSAYLHPIGDRLLIGVGQDATETGREKGTKVSLYDMADLANPREIQSYVLWNSTSTSADDFHAFMWWDPTKLAVLPVDRAYVGYIGGDCSGPSGCTPAAYIPPFTGAIGLTIDRDGIKELGRIVNPGSSVPVGGRCGVVGPCEPPCPSDATCTSNGPGATGTAIDCSKTPCTDPPAAPVPVSTTIPTTVPCPPDADCGVRPIPPIAPCSTDPRVGIDINRCVPPVNLGARITRTLVVGDTLYSFSDNGLKSSELSTLKEKFWLALR